MTDPQQSYPQQPNPQQPYSQQPNPGPADGWRPLSDDERNWAIAAHVGAFAAAYVALGLVAPLIVLLVKGNTSPYIRRHAVESLNFQINALVIVTICFILIFVLIGIPMIIAYGVFYIVMVILGTVAASAGRDYRYPLTVRLVH